MRKIVSMGAVVFLFSETCIKVKIVPLQTNGSPRSFGWATSVNTIPGYTVYVSSGQNGIFAVACPKDKP